jgi:hypothetical protein
VAGDGVGAAPFSSQRTVLLVAAKWSRIACSTVSLPPLLRAFSS